MVTLPVEPVVPNTAWDLIQFWDYSEEAMQVTQFFQQALERLPTVFRVSIALAFMFLVIGVLIRSVVDLL